MILVLDANAGIEIVLDREKSALLNGFLSRADKVLTSDLYKAETANVIFKYVRSGLLDKDQAIEKLLFCDSLIDEFVDISMNKEEALMESIHSGHSTYDLLYLTLARRTGARLLSLDKKLNLLANKMGLETIGAF
jgi:predicted nucleic acid-binding protein